jgi:RNA polymerase sigma-70 factor (ECF subfamily)
MALRALGDPEAAEEVAQETLVRTVAALRDRDPEDPRKLGAFVAGIARHVIADALRARYRAVPLDTVPEHVLPASDPDPLDALVSSAEAARVRAALAALGARDRELLRLSFFEGLTPTELGARFAEPVARIRKRKSRALERLRRAFARGSAGHEAGGSTTGREDAGLTRPRRLS